LSERLRIELCNEEGNHDLAACSVGPGIVGAVFCLQAPKGLGTFQRVGHANRSDTHRECLSECRQVFQGSEVDAVVARKLPSATLKPSLADPHAINVADVGQLAVKREHSVTVNRSLPAFALERNLMRDARAHKLVVDVDFVPASAAPPTLARCATCTPSPCKLSSAS
jgi:hypothetical protein